MVISVVLIEFMPFNEAVPLLTKILSKFYLQVLPLFLILLVRNHYLQIRIRILVMTNRIHQLLHCLLIVRQLRTNQCINSLNPVNILLISPLKLCHLNTILGRRYFFIFASINLQYF